MNLFGWFYVILTIAGLLIKANEIGKPREPVTALDFNSILIVTILLFLGLYTWGLRP